MDNWVTGTMVYVVVWWLMFFVVLPFGTHPVDAEDLGKGHATSAPKKPRILIKMAITTVLAAVVWGGGFWLAQSGLISFRP